ncbi:phosphopyruvate hydratase [Patescibacteria group bacterium]|nr:phosphopyruvate hydratase [Patescibacteria group bacterium]
MANFPLIKDLTAREILDSRGNPTLQVAVVLSDESVYSVAVPSGVSTGRHEAWELRDGDSKRYNGLGVLKAIDNVTTEIKRALKGRSMAEIKKLDELLLEVDGTVNKSKLGANALLGVSMALMRAGAGVAGQPLYIYLADIFGFKITDNLPVPMMNVINGGCHADNGLSFQEFMIVPKRIVKGKFSATESVRAGAEIFHILGKILKTNKLNTNVGNEGGYAPNIKEAKEVLGLLQQAILEAGYKSAEVGLALDVAASEFYESGVYTYQGQTITADGLIKLYDSLSRDFNLISIEDGLAEDDWHNWKIMTEQLGKKLMLVGDDLFVTNLSRLRQGIVDKTANAILIKPNQIGTIGETIMAVKEAQANNYKVIVSHRSGETMDDFIVDLAVAVGANYLKAGAPSRGERVAKYNRLMTINQDR